MGEPTEEDKQNSRKVDEAIRMLMEHFDCVQIFCQTYHPGADGGTHHVERGDGNWYARMSQLDTWLIEQKEIIKCQVRKQQSEE